MKKLYFFMLAAMLMVCSTSMAQTNKDAEHPWAGNYTLMLVDDEPFASLPEEADQYITSIPDTFEVEIKWNAEQGKYLVTKFYSFPTSNLSAGGFELKVIDDKNAEIVLVNEKFHSYGVLPAETVYETDTLETGEVVIDTINYKETTIGLMLTDETSSPYSIEKPVKVYMNSDGQISIDAFQIIFISRSSMGWYRWSDGACPLNGGDEPVAVEPRDWKGWYWMKADDYMFMSLDGNEYAEEGAFEIADDGYGNFIVTKFMGYDTATANAFSGGIYLTPSKKNANKATIDCDGYMNLLVSEDGMSGLALYDGSASNGPIEIEYDEATNTITFDIFCYAQATMSGTMSEEGEAAWCFSATAVPGDPTAITAVATKASPKTQLYDLQGRKVAAPVKGQLYIRGDKKVMINK